MISFTGKQIASTTEGPRTSWKARLQFGPHASLLVVILVIAAWLRVDGIAWALPTIAHPDEARIVDYVIASAPGIPSETFSDYGTVSFYLLQVTGWFASLLSSGYSLHDPSDAVSTYVLARFLAALFGVGTVALAYAAGSLAYDRKVGLLAAAFLALTVLAVQLSHSYIVDTILVFWTTLFLVIGMWLIQHPREILYILLALVAGIALATKFVALFLLFPLAIALYLAERHRTDEKAKGPKESVTLIRFGLRFLATLAIAAAVFLLLTPAAVRHPAEYWWLDFDDPNWWYPGNFPAGNHNLLWNLLLSEKTVRPLWALASMPAVPLANPLTNLLPWSMGPVLVAISVMGIVLALRQRTTSDWFLLSYLLAGYLIIANSHVQFIRYVYPIVPVLVILAARAVMALSPGSANSIWLKAATLTALAVTLMISALYSLAFTSIYRSTDTRLQAEKWIQENIPVGATIGIDGPDRFSNPFVDPSTYQIHILPVYKLYDDSAPHTYPSSGFLTLLLGKRLPPKDNMGHLTDEEIKPLIELHLKSSYLVITNRLTEQVETITAEFEGIREYYRTLFRGGTDYVLVKAFESQPRLWNLKIDDSSAEHTFKIFDHPSIFIFRRIIR